MVILSGGMGAGKTAFTVGFARALGVNGDEYVSSPTFTLVHTYASGRIPLHHADLYRLGSVGEVADLGLREQVDLGAVALVEWGDVAQEVLGDTLKIHLENDVDDDDVRHITVSVVGHAWDSRWDRLKDSLRRWMVPA
jgi:tRNA threonylcarbamoyladenosine biosynthesis protein TsaE